MQLPEQQPKPFGQESPRNPQQESPSQAPLQHSSAMLHVQKVPAGRQELPLVPPVLEVPALPLAPPVLLVPPAAFVPPLLVPPAEFVPPLLEVALAPPDTVAPPVEPPSPPDWLEPPLGPPSTPTPPLAASLPPSSVLQANQNRGATATLATNKRLTPIL